jgi:aminoglycoside 3-N-acetyltransferase
MEKLIKKNLIMNNNPFYAHTDFANYYLHSLLNPKGKKFNKKETLQEMLKDLINISSNRLIIPTYNYDFGVKKNFNIYKDKSQVGYFSEFFRKKFNRNRSHVPFYSDCSTQKIKRIINEDCISPFGKNSVFEYLYKHKGKIIFFGSEFSPTYIHYIETKFIKKIKYRFHKNFYGTVSSKNKKKEIILKMHVVPKKLKIKYDLLRIKQDLIKKKILNLKKINMNFCYYVCDVRKFHNYSLNKLNKNPFYFLTSKSIKNIKNYLS